MHRHLILLLLGIGVVSAIAALAPTPKPVLAGGGPGAGWVKARVVSGGCIDTGTCDSGTHTGPLTLYEYAPDRASFARGQGPGPQHGGHRTAEARDTCQVGGVSYGRAAGVWHHGASWQKRVTVTTAPDPDNPGKTIRTVVTTWIGPTNWHWAFEHNDRCEPPPATATPVPGAPTAVPAPGSPEPTPVSGEPSDPSVELPPATPFVPPTALPSPCTKRTEPFPLWQPYAPDGQALPTTGPGPMISPSTTQLRFTLDATARYDYADPELDDNDVHRWAEANLFIKRLDDGTSFANYHWYVGGSGDVYKFVWDKERDRHYSGMPDPVGSAN